MKNTRQKNLAKKLLLVSGTSLLLSGFLSSPLLAQDEKREGRRAEHRKQMAERRGEFRENNPDIAARRDEHRERRQEYRENNPEEAAARREERRQRFENGEGPRGPGGPGSRGPRPNGRPGQNGNESGPEV